uniref:PAN2-PAN3 deadenylation complex catalytic subunit PAN2-like n=1 Tax=Styela clava TaxID=7725 RepID=UPI00193A7EC8|nr:PAN2-PAN3 deadenylation complex catalytic subunit PAN2-like [Styela clava]
MAGEYKELHSVLIDGAPRFGTSALSFDNELELLWSGNMGGHITSYCGASLQKYTSFQIDARNPVIGIETVKDRVLSLTKDRVTCHSKFGLKEYEFLPESTFSIESSMLYKDTSLLIGGKSSRLIELDLNTGASPVRDFTDEGKMENGVMLFRSSPRFICCGDVAGNIILRDRETLKAQHVFNAHTGTLSDFDIHGHLLVTCGYSLRHGMDRSIPQSLTLDRVIKVFDTRMMRTVTPIQAHIQPAFVRFIPTYTRRLIIMNERGQFILIEDNAAVTPSTPIYQLNNMCGNITSFAMSNSMQTLAFGDSGGHLQLWSSSANPTFHQYQKMPEFAPIPEPLEHRIAIDDYSIPLSVIPMPRCREKLLSDWPLKYCNPVSRRPPPIDPNIIQTMKIVHGIGYAPNPGNRRRNQVPYKLKDIAKQDKMGKKAAVPDSPLGREEQPHLYMVPKKYRKISLKYSKLGFEEDSMIQHYNRTNFAGLDPNILNAYCNSMLQVLYFLQPLRSSLLQYHNLEKEFDLAEELGFLFRMQDLSKGGVLQASNFLRAFRTIPEATALGLVQNSSQPEQVGTSTHGNLSQLVQNWNCFILQQLQTELSQAPPRSPDYIFQKEPNVPNKTAMEKIFGTEMKISTNFKNGNSSERMAVQLIFTLNYPPLPPPGEPPKLVPFTDIITRSICSKVQTKSYDPNSATYQPMEQLRTPVSLPEVLALNCGLMRDDEMQFWKIQMELLQQMNAARVSEIDKKRKLSKEENGENTGKKNDSAMPDDKSDAWNVFAEREGLDLSFDQQHKATWLPLSITLALTKSGELKVTSNDSKSPHHKKSESNDANNGDTDNDIVQESTYDLYTTICHIVDPRTGGNLVAHVNVGEKYHQLKEGVTHTQWYLFNDFQICSIDAVEAVDFDLQWKLPAIIYYARRDMFRRSDFNVAFPLTASILSPSESLSKSHPQSPAPITFTPLMPAELPSCPGMLVALDAEFVTLNNEEAELHSDGTRSTIKPSHLSLARVTVVRGEGDIEGLPFIDDYISTQEQVVDYLTKFSGILPGDLDASISSKHLSTLKLTYCKLSYLVHCGCIIIGHGLRKDFKVINIVVPATQIRDTVYLFHLPRKRFISLRFLAWYFLETKIQEKNHDSIEDARTALKLYKKYLELTENETQVLKFQQTVLKDMYEEGRKLEWKVPGTDM